MASCLKIKSKSASKRLRIDYKIFEGPATNAFCLSDAQSQILLEQVEIIVGGNSFGTYLLSTNPGTRNC